MKKIFCFVMAVAFVFAFSTFVKSHPKQSRVNKNIFRKRIPMPKVLEFGSYTFGRRSDKKDSSGMFMPPYKTGEIVNIFFNVKPKLKENLTVIPLQADLPSLDLKIMKSEKSDFLDCNVSPAAYAQEVELEPVTARRWLEIAPIRNRSSEYPFDVFLIYPSVSFAKKINPNRLKKSMFPRGVYLKTITGAIDLTNDGKPDLLETKFCRNNEKLSAENCDYTAGQLFKKVGGVWKSVKYISSCT